MIAVSSIAAAGTRRRLHSLGNGTGYWKTSYFDGEGGDTPPGEKPVIDPERLHPMALLVEQDPSSELQAHFHEADQFQVVVAGDGTIGREQVGQIALHYASAYTTYGPILAGAGGLSYFTLRNGFEFKAWHMPESREHLSLARRRPPRVGMGRFDFAEVMQAAPAAGSVRERAVMPMAPDGLAAWLYVAGAGAMVAGHDPLLGRGQHWLVLSGSFADGPLQGGPKLSCGFLRPDEAALRARAGAEGVVALVMQYPLHDALDSQAPGAHS